MLHRIKNWLVLEDENMPTELKLGRLDHLDGIGNRTCYEKDMAA